MVNKKLVSILIPLYNAEKYIGETIESALNQTYDNIEIIVLDDGSKDSSLNIANQYAKKFKNVLVYTQENKGVQATRNKLFQLSKGDYIQYLDADDLLEKNKIKYQMECLNDCNTDAVSFCKWTTFSGNAYTNAHFSELQIYKNFRDPLEFLVQMWTNLEAVSPHCWLVSRSLVEKSGGWDLRLIKNQDGEFFARIVALSSQVVFSENSKVYYRIDSANSISKNNSERAVDSILESFDSYENVLTKYKNKQKVNYAIGRVYSNFLFSIYPEHEKAIIKINAKLAKLGYDKPLPTTNSKIVLMLYHFIGAINTIRLLKAIKNFRNRIL